MQYQINVINLIMNTLLHIRTMHQIHHYTMIKKNSSESMHKIGLI